MEKDESMSKLSKKTNEIIKDSRYVTFLKKNPKIKEEIFDEVGLMYTKYKDYYLKGNIEYLKNVFVAIPLYHFFVSNGKAKEEAVKELGDIMYDYLSKERKVFEFLFKSRLLYTFLRKAIPSKFEKLNDYGWIIRNEKQEKGEIFFTVKKCLVFEILEKENLPELGRIFCGADLYLYTHLPYTEFKRKGTIAKGSLECDMRFVRRKEKDFDRYPSV